MKPLAQFGDGERFPRHQIAVLSGAPGFRRRVVNALCVLTAAPRC